MQTHRNVCCDSLVTHYLLSCSAAVHLLLNTLHVLVEGLRGRTERKVLLCGREGVLFSFPLFPEKPTRHSPGLPPSPLPTPLLLLTSFLCRGTICSHNVQDMPLSQTRTQTAKSLWILIIKRRSHFSNKLALFFEIRLLVSVVLSSFLQIWNSRVCYCFILFSRELPTTLQRLASSHINKSKEDRCPISNEQQTERRDFFV